MTEKRLALIIASYQYKDPDLRQLIAPAQDAKALAQVLADPGIGGFEVQMLLNEPLSTVNPAIESFFATGKRDNLLLLYFSGHGIKDEDGRLYFATIDTRLEVLRTTAIQATVVNDVMRRSRSRRQVLLLDCCYSGAFAKGMVAKADKTIGTGTYLQGRGRVVLTASDAWQYAFEGGKIKGKGVRSVFTHALVRGLETGEADLNGDGCISLDELYDYVYDHVTDKTPHQRPERWALGVQGKIIIAQTPSGIEELIEPPPTESSIAKVCEGLKSLLGRLRESKMSRRAALSAALVLLVLVLVLGTMSIWDLESADRTPLATSTASLVPELNDPVRVGIATFSNCPQEVNALPDAIDLESDEVAYKSLGEIQDSASARTYSDLDLIIWGQCLQPDQLVMHLEILAVYSPDEVSELERITAQTSSLDLNHAGGLGRAVSNYLHGDYEEAIGSLATLEQEARTPSEGAELAFLRANSLLFIDQPDRYEKAIRAYDVVLAYEHAPLLAQAYNNRGVAGVNWALLLGRSGLPYETVLEVALNDLEVAATTTYANLAATAYVNLGAAQYWIAEDFDHAVEYCEKAIELAPEQPLGYVCRAAARYWMLDEAYCDPPPDTTSARDDLAKAERQDPDLVDVFFWRGALAELQADCHTVEKEEQRYRQDAMDDFRVFYDYLANRRTVKLTSDQVMYVLLPDSLSQDY